MDKGFVMVGVPSGADILDVAIMQHGGREVTKLMADVFSDLGEYGSGEEYEAEVLIKFKKVEVK